MGSVGNREQAFDPKSDALHSCVVGLLAPVVRLAMLGGMRGDEIQRALSSALVHVAGRHIRNVEGREPTSARMAFYTSLSKHEVDAALDSTKLGRSNRLEFAHRLSELLGAWHSERGYTGPFSLPLHINIYGKTGPSLEALANKYVPGEPLDRVLHTLLEAKAVERIEDQVTVLTPSFPTKWEEASQLDRLGVIGPAYLETLVTNLYAETTGDASLFEATALTEAPIDSREFEEFVLKFKEAGRTFLHEQDKVLNSATMTSPGIEGGIGVYAFKLGNAPARMLFSEPRNGPVSVS